MRVWKLASWGGLLALAACSADQTSSPQVDLTADREDDPAQVMAQSEPAVDLSRRVARPEIRPSRPLSRSQYPLTRTQGQTMLPGDRAASPSAAALQARVKQIRAQQAKATPTVGVPLPGQPIPSEGRDRLSPTDALTGSDRALTGPTAAGNLSRGGLPTVEPIALPIVTALPTPARPSPAIAAAPGLTTAAPSAGSEFTATALGATQPATLARNFPISVARHQGYSHRLGAAPVLTPRASQDRASQDQVNEDQVSQAQVNEDQVSQTQRRGDDALTVARVHQTSLGPTAHSAPTPASQTRTVEAAEGGRNPGGRDPGRLDPAIATTAVTPEPANVVPPSPGPNSPAHLSSSSPPTLTVPAPRVVATATPAAPRFSSNATAPTRHLSGVEVSGVEVAPQSAQPRSPVVNPARPPHQAEALPASLPLYSPTPGLVTPRDLVNLERLRSQPSVSSFSAPSANPAAAVEAGFLPGDLPLDPMEIAPEDAPAFPFNPSDHSAEGTEPTNPGIN
jgi:hypothetical protein